MPWTELGIGAAVLIGGVVVLGFLDWWLWHQDRRDKESA